MKPYKVIWVIDIEAESPLEAAQQAQEIMQDKFSTAQVFNVVNVDGGRADLALAHVMEQHTQAGNIVEIDLLD